MKIIWLILILTGLISGILAGLLGIGGGVILVPILVTLGILPVKAVATSSLAILITAISGTIENYRKGYINFKKVIYLGIPAIITSQIGVYLANLFPGYILLGAFAFLLIVNIYLLELKQSLVAAENNLIQKPKISPILARIFTGSSAGILAGLFGVGGGVIMVPLQILLLEEEIKPAIQTSLGVIMITGLSSAFGHALKGNVLFLEGVILGIGGLLGAQIGTRFLPKIPDKYVSLIFRSFLGILSLYMLAQAVIKYDN